MTATKQSSYSRRIVSLLGSSKFFWVIVALFVVQAAWIALSGRYPMAFDEDYHLGIIRLYSHHISPFWGSQPSGADAFGAVFRDPSYLYQWLMSFPYRLISVFTDNVAAQVIVLRFINIALFASALGIFRRVLLKTGASRAIVHACLLLFIFIPVVPLLAAQINYDNLFIPMVGLVLLLAINFDSSLKRGKPLHVSLLGQLAIVCLLTSLIKYAFLPVFLAIAVYILVHLLRTYGGLRPLWRGFVSGVRLLSRRSLVILSVGLVLALGLFVERYGVNTVRYHTPVPDCAQVLSVKQCSAYPPWIRDYNLELAKVHGNHNPVKFMDEWLYGMWFRLNFAVDGPASNFETRAPFVVPGISGIVFAAVGFLAVVRYLPRLFRIYNARVLSLLLSVTVIYVALLWIDEFRAYARTGQPVAINGRYLLPVLLPALLVAALAVNELLRRKIYLKLAVSGVALLSLLWGGGALTYILRSHDSWYWQNSSVRTANHAVQRTLGPVTPGYRFPSEFLR